MSRPPLSNSGSPVCTIRLAESNEATRQPGKVHTLPLCNRGQDHWHLQQQTAAACAVPGDRRCAKLRHRPRARCSVRHLGGLCKQGPAPQRRQAPVSVLVSVVAVRHRPRRAWDAGGPLGASRQTSRNTGSRTWKAGWVGRPRGFESRILRHPDRAQCSVASWPAATEGHRSLGPSLHWHPGRLRVSPPGFSSLHVSNLNRSAQDAGPPPRCPCNEK
jgi:hypothetical protein